MVIQRLHPRSTVPGRIKKLKYLERNGIDLINIDENQVHTFFYDKIQAGSANVGLNNYVKALNSWMKFREIEKKFDKFKEHISPIKVPSIADVQAMLDIVRDRNPHARRDRMLIVFFCKTGLRCAELCNLKLDDIDWKNAEKMVKKGKGGKDRIIPVERKVLYGHNYPSLKNYIKMWRFPIGDTILQLQMHQLLHVILEKE
jgi:site-specific recombinase XerD